jgi:hypothetical protein
MFSTEMPQRNQKLQSCRNSSLNKKRLNRAEWFNLFLASKKPTFMARIKQGVRPNLTTKDNLWLL